MVTETETGLYFHNQRQCHWILIFSPRLTTRVWWTGLRRAGQNVLGNAPGGVTIGQQKVQLNLASVQGTSDVINSEICDMLFILSL